MLFWITSDRNSPFHKPTADDCLQHSADLFPLTPAPGHNRKNPSMTRHVSSFRDTTHFRTCLSARCPVRLTQSALQTQRKASKTLIIPSWHSAVQDFSSCFGPRCQSPHGHLVQLCPGASYPSMKGTPGTPSTPSAASVTAGRGLCFSGSPGTCPNSKQHSAAPFSCDEATVDPKVHKRGTLPSY